MAILIRRYLQTCKLQKEKSFSMLLIYNSVKCLESVFNLSKKRYISIFGNGENYDNILCSLWYCFTCRFINIKWNPDLCEEITETLLIVISVEISFNPTRCYHVYQSVNIFYIILRIISWWIKTFYSTCGWQQFSCACGVRYLTVSSSKRSKKRTKTAGQNSTKRMVLDTSGWRSCEW